MKLTFNSVADAERYLYGNPALTQSRINSHEFVEAIQASGFESDIVHIIHEHAESQHDVPSMLASLHWTINPTIDHLFDELPADASLESEQLKQLLACMVHREEYLQQIFEKTGEAFWLCNRLLGTQEMLRLIEEAGNAPSSTPEVRLQTRQFILGQYGKLLGNIQDSFKNLKLNEDETAHMLQLQQEVEEKFNELNETENKIN